MTGTDPAFLWPQARIDELRSLWGSGLSARDIGARLGVSRNAVLGKAHRLGLSNARPKPKQSRGWSQAAKERQARARIIRKVFGEQPRPPKPLRPPKASNWDALPGSNPVPLELLDGCKWPIGQDSPYMFCGEAHAPGKSYCPQHQAISTGNPAEITLPALDLTSANVDNASGDDERFVLANKPAATLEAPRALQGSGNVNTSVRSAA